MSENESGENNGSFKASQEELDRRLLAVEQVFIVLVLCLGIGVLRFTLPTHGLQTQDIFKDVAHLWVGGLFGAALATMRWQWWTLALGMTLLEGVAFFSR